MFGMDAFYVEDKIMFALREKDTSPKDNGIWIATKTIHHTQLNHIFKSIKAIEVYGIKNWRMLPVNSDHFETDATTLAELMRSRNPIVGVLPKPKKRKSQR
jgi:hypothetical protein